MKVPLDEMLPADVAGLLPGHEVVTSSGPDTRDSRTESSSIER